MAEPYFYEKMNRRNFLTIGGGLAVSSMLPVPQSFGKQPSARPHSIKAILFDAFPIFDPAPVAGLAAQLFPEHSASLLNIWRTKQFEYTWLRSLTGRYLDFLSVTADALDYSAASLNMDVSAQQHRQLVDAYNELPAWPEVPAILGQLNADGYRLGMLSNFTPGMLRNNVQYARLSHHFEHLLSVDTVRTYKPAARAYQLAMEEFRLPKEEILFVPFAGWDAAGAKSFGYLTFWVNRLGTPTDRLGIEPDGEGRNLNQLMDWLKSSHLR